MSLTLHFFRKYLKWKCRTQLHRRLLARRWWSTYTSHAFYLQFSLGKVYITWQDVWWFPRYSQLVCRFSPRQNLKMALYSQMNPLSHLKLAPLTGSSETFYTGQYSNPLTLQCWGYFRPKRKGVKMFENHLNPVMLVFIGELSLSTLWWIPIFKGFNHFQFFLHHFLLAKSTTTSIRGKPVSLARSS